MRLKQRSECADRIVVLRVGIDLHGDVSLAVLVENVLI